MISLLVSATARFGKAMSPQASVSQLPRPVRDLVLAATQGTQDFGKSEKDKAKVSDWLSKIAEGTVTHSSATQDLNAQLTPRTYLVSNYLTAADVALYGALHPVLSQLQPAQYYSHPALTRYFDHIQTRPAVRKAADSLSPAFSTVTFDLDKMPPLERKSEPPKKKEKAANVAEGSLSAAIQRDVSAIQKDTAELKINKKEKRDGKKKEEVSGGQNVPGKKGAGTGNATTPNDSGDPVPSMIDLRVGRIIDIMKHPDADGLYVEQIDIGEETGPRTVVSGLVNYIPIEEMRDKYLVAVCNLKPANMRGVKSHAMVLCATAKEGRDGGIEIVQPPQGAKPGDRVYFEGAEYEDASPVPQLNPKKKIFETIQPGFITLESREAAWINPTTKSVHKIRTQDGVCVAPSFVGASLS